MEAFGEFFFLFSPPILNSLIYCKSSTLSCSSEMPPSEMSLIFQIAVLAGLHIHPSCYHALAVDKAALWGRATPVIATRSASEITECSSCRRHSASPQWLTCAPECSGKSLTAALTEVHGCDAAPSCAAWGEKPEQQVWRRRWCHR